MNRIADFIITLEGKEINKFAFNKGKSVKIIIGKDKNADISINQAYISRRHAEILKDENDNIFIIDLESTNGIYINSKRI